MPNLSVLYIHGYGSDQNSTTANVLRTQLAPHNIDVHSPTIPANAHEAIPFVKNYIAKNDIRIIVASSLGAFIALKQNLDKFIIVCNPCIALIVMNDMKRLFYRTWIQRPEETSSVFLVQMMNYSPTRPILIERRSPHYLPPTSTESLRTL